MQTIPERTVIPLERADVKIEPGDLAYALEHEADIAANWLREKAANPALFNGPFFMAEQAVVMDGLFKATYRRTHFQTMMHWKQNPSLDKPWHIFAVGV